MWLILLLFLGIISTTPILSSRAFVPVVGVVKDFRGDGDDVSFASAISVNPVVAYEDGIGGTGGGGDVVRGGVFNLVGVEFSLSDVASEFQFQSRLKSRLLTYNLGSRGGGEEEDRGREKDGIATIQVDCIYALPLHQNSTKNEMMSRSRGQ